MGFKDHFSTGTAAYAAFRPRYPAALARHLAGLAPARRLALDCGCGTGQFSVELALHFERVVASDASKEQLAVAEPHDRIEYRLAPAERSGLDDGTCDLVTAAQAAHWFEIHAFNREVRRVLRPGGVIALITYGVIDIDGPVGESLHRFYWQTLQNHWPEERRHVETGYRELPFPFEEVPAPAMDMSAMWSRDALLGYLGTWSAVRRAEAASGGSVLLALADELGAAWPQADERRNIRWPLGLRLGRV